MNIEIQSLVKQFGDFRALDNVSLNIADGELFFLLGPSGCGKTTLLRCIGGFELPTSGKILMDGTDVANRPPNLRNTAMVFQGYALWPHLTVRKNIAFGLEMQKVRGEELNRRVEEAMRRVQIEQLGDRRPNELSGGQQQRVALARTLVVQPGCLLLDEPLANLDAKLRRDMRREIRALCKDTGLTAIYVTHDRQEALSMADRVAVLKDGRIVQIAQANELYRRPVNAFVASFIGETNFVQGTLKTVASGHVEVETAAGLLHAIQAPNGVSAGAKVTLSIRPEAISLLESATPNRLQATLSDTAYLGELANHVALTANGDLRLTFLELNPTGEARPGQQFPLFIRPEDVIVLPYAENPE
ncbi:MAG: ABC transporter ATP-binding protein [Victivallales bacterium]|nr:ABC transporter ATP-binding protein [Victivallales bacterium]